MAVWNKVRSLFRSPPNHPQKNSSPGFEPHHQTHKESHMNQQSRNTDSDDGEDLCRNLSEVAAPEPVQRLSPQEQARRPSLEKRLSDMSRSGHERDDEIYENLSELAAPEPVERLSESELARRPSLEQSFSQSR
ncbi:uncharacterized protein APUU_11695A [Aspergillus puulaauensis]|uniref:Uncharacterized protein n=1 Tax=Aspergillus puulaauensis TaxID=1220207 RepID=A0A7R8AHW1_9EURO|nr:uncharacterized protein APUU_11695A [Aspergillus puulaauensis]BCS18867.1 hypothetical protein APUU_11695A [Aspergillus puulaauensis]